MKKKIIIFGSRGNLGKYITPYLKKRNLVFSPSSSDCNLKKLLSIDSFFKKIPNEKYIIIYLATKVSKNKNNLKNYNSNILMVKNLLKILKNYRFEKFIYFSSVDVYCKYINKKILFESSAIKSNNLYSKSKITDESFLKNKIIKNKLLIFRIPGVYGLELNSFINNLKDSFIDNRPVKIYNKGENFRDFLYIIDIAKIISIFIKSDYSGTYNISTGKSISIMEIVKIFQKKYNSKSKIIYPTKTNNNSNYNLFISNAKILKKLINFSFTTIQSGINKI
tara:strand:+ start:9566 stop:10402 length:837 start_codon:yes stop_codon:yes gene_type:complete